MAEDQKGILDLAPERLTPGMRQYQEVKREHPDCLVMLRMGDFYEMFYEDAITASRELDITLTARGMGEKRAPLAGIPYHALDTYLGRLVKKGHKVAIVEQLEDPKKAKGLVKRGLVRIVTPGTVIESSLLLEKENNYLLALTAQGDEFAFACCDLSTGEFVTGAVEGLPQLWGEIARYGPRECVIPESLRVNQELLELLQKNCFVNALEDYYFRPEKGREKLLQHFQLRTLDSFGLEKRPLQMGVSGALLHYLIDTQKNALSHLKKISVLQPRSLMLLDAATIHNLELVQNQRDGTLRGTLLSVLDQTVTAGGSRLLKRWIQQPLLQQDPVRQRLDGVEELYQNVLLREVLASLLEHISDLERLIGRVNYGTATPRDLLSLRNSLQQIPLLQEKLLGCRSTLLKDICGLASLQDVTQLITAAIQEEAPVSVREGNIIQNQYHAELDLLRDIKSNSKKYLQQIEERERERTGISTLRIGYTRVFGYFLEVTRKNISLVPSSYIRKQTTANSERYVTEDLKLEEEKILGAEEKIVELEYDLFQQLVRQVTERTADVQEAAGRLAVLDVLCSLARVALEQGYVRPELVDEPVIQLQKSRHPVVEKLAERFIANDVFIPPQEMLIITGSNMSGKSTVMRQVALIVLLAQIGSFVPAERAVLGIVDRIFTRVGASDDLASGQSTFLMEMSETAAILHHATDHSLIILDEIGRGTSTFDGVSLAWSVAEHIQQRIKAKTLFSTHYHVLQKLAETFSSIKNYHLAVKEVQDEIVFLYKLLPGGTDQSFGVHVAKLAGLPSEVVERAREIQSVLEKDDEMVRKMKVKKLEEQKRLEGF